ncbi:MAG: aminotransferase class I/II-fold pyridoxal phosphate-dependent enzyme [Caldilineaceae bacterium]|nr:aminotransferase class I/II-fold pyridoxal phosphate-dependent enzyme [Caldilineaceae bacterium]
MHNIDPREHDALHPDDWALASLVIHADDEFAVDSSIAPPIYQTATFRAESAADFADMATQPRHARYYTRYGNPTLARVEKIVAELEGAESALVTASGMGAITTTVFALVQQGDHVVAQRNHYMGTTKLLTEILPRFGVTTTLVDQTDPAAFAAALRPETKLILVETPANPTLPLTDLAAIAALARPRGILTFCDNTFASPYNQRPLTHGIDLVMHSATKYLGGHHDLSAGVVAGTQVLIDKIWDAHLVVGSVLGPIDAWLLLRGLRTFAVRVKQQNQTALALAQYLASHPAIEQVYYPGLPSHPQYELAQRQMRGFGGVLSFAVKGGYAATQRFIAALKLPTQAVSLGGYESLVVHAAAMWEGTLGEAGLLEAGIQPNLVRYAVGLEDADDLIADLSQALETV